MLSFSMDLHVAPTQFRILVLCACTAVVAADSIASPVRRQPHIKGAFEKPGPHLEAGRDNVTTRNANDLHYGRQHRASAEEGKYVNIGGAQTSPAITRSHHHHDVAHRAKESRTLVENIVQISEVPLQGPVDVYGQPAAVSATTAAVPTGAVLTSIVIVHDPPTTTTTKPEEDGGIAGATLLWIIMAFLCMCSIPACIIAWNAYKSRSRQSAQLARAWTSGYVPPNAGQMSPTLNRASTGPVQAGPGDAVEARRSSTRQQRSASQTPRTQPRPVSQNVEDGTSTNSFGLGAFRGPGPPAGAPTLPLAPRGTTQPPGAASPAAAPAGRQQAVTRMPSGRSTTARKPQIRAGTGDASEADNFPGI